MKRHTIILFALFLFCGWTAYPQAVDNLIQSHLPEWLEAYRHLHSNPELSYEEKNTAVYLVQKLRQLGFEVTEGVGKYAVPDRVSYGFVAVMRNGEGPTVLVRTDLDALPVEEQTGLPYASRARVKNPSGEEVGVMHACGHDIHMTSFLGTAQVLSSLKEQWRGTLVMIGQPAEERGTGALAMLRDGLYTRFPRPDYALALHAEASTEAGSIGICPGYALAAVDTIDIWVRGVGGHGAYPHKTVDPIVLASQIIVNLQTIVSRQVSPLDSAVVTVGAIQGGTKHNIIPDEVHLQLTVRSYKPEVRRTILDGIRRISRGVALAAGVPEDRMPEVRIAEEEYTPATYNDPELSERLLKVLRTRMGQEQVNRIDPVMGGEDFGRYTLEDRQIPTLIFWLGVVDPAKVRESRESGKSLPSLHSSEFAPLPEPTIRGGVKAMSTAVLELMQ